MGLALSSLAAPDLSIDALDAACRERGLDGDELVLPPGFDPERVPTTGARIVALRVEAIDARSAPGLAQRSAKLEVPVSVPRGGVADLPAVVAAFSKVGGRLLLAEGSHLDAMVALARSIRERNAGDALGIAWELRPSSESLEDAGAILFAIRDLLGLVRLHGGGPEQHEQDGLGVGGVLADLALSKYAGATVLCPSSPEKLGMWTRWLASRKATGCGTRAEQETLDLDMRPVEPRDRYETIMGAYRALSRGSTMRLTLDHDPSCMYYTLEATEAEGSFAFRRIDDGPEVWRAEVTKL
ncbi:MAG TPA: DUF2249 domain-containing protein [Vulgatibacter sp.]|nr:DUF2249 domain-containing protein [Vulgatibacter sp.]